MDSKQPFRSVGQSYLITIALIALGAGLCIWPLDALEFRTPWMTFYPIAICASYHGGLGTGVAGTVLICLLILDTKIFDALAKHGGARFVYKETL